MHIRQSGQWDLVYSTHVKKAVLFNLYPLPHPTDSLGNVFSLVVSVVSETEHLALFEEFVQEIGDNVCIIYKQDKLIDYKVISTLWAHYDSWVGIGASSFALSSIANVYIPHFGLLPSFNSEPSNKVTGTIQFLQMGL